MGGESTRGLSARAPHAAPSDLPSWACWCLRPACRPHGEASTRPWFGDPAPGMHQSPVDAVLTGVLGDFRFGRPCRAVAVTREPCRGRQRAGSPRESPGVPWSVVSMRPRRPDGRPPSGGSAPGLGHWHILVTLESARTFLGNRRPLPVDPHGRLLPVLGLDSGSVPPLSPGLHLTVPLSL